MGMSNDGRLVLYRVMQQSLAGPAFVADTATGERTSLELPDGELATDGVLSGSGNIAFLVTTKGRIARVEIAHAQQGAITSVVPETPYIQNPSGLTPGAVVELTGSLPDTVEAASGRILLDERPLPVLYASSRRSESRCRGIEKTDRTELLRLDVLQNPRFGRTSSYGLATCRRDSSPLRTGETSALGFKAVRGDFSALLTTDPQPGEIFHVYMTGLGPVENQERLQTTVPRPIRRYSRFSAPMHCRFAPYTTDADTLFAGLAPGMIGIYQVTFRMPDGRQPRPHHRRILQRHEPIRRRVNMIWNRAGSN